MTFRRIGPQFKNSLFICGDSNTRHLKFGEENGSFGKWLPGKRHEAMFIKDIPSPEFIGPHKNIVIHTGINNLKQDHHPPIRELVFEIERKCAAIHRVYPNTKICLSPILPTKSAALNAKANEFNSYLGQLSQKHPNLIRLDYTAMCNINGLLDSQYERHRDGVPYEHM